MMEKQVLAPGRIANYFKTEFLTELASCAMMALAIKMFSAPNLIVGGGVSGIASVLYVLFGLPIGAVSFALNLPLLLWGWRVLGMRFALRTMRVVAVMSLVTDILLLDIPPYGGEKLLAAIYGGVLLGAGLGLIMKRGDTTGGTDIVVKILQLKKPHLSIGTLVMLIDASIVALAAAAYNNLDTILYGAVMVFVSSTVIDKIILGAQMRKLSIIITPHGEKVTQRLLSQLDRGVTVLNGAGGFTKKELSVLLCVAENRQVARLKRLTYEVDPKAFIIIANAAETLGKGFKAIEEL